MVMGLFNGMNLLFSYLVSSIPDKLYQITLVLFLVYAFYVFTCVFGNWYYRRKYPEKYIRGPDGNILRQKSYFLNDLKPDETHTSCHAIKIKQSGLENKSYDPSRLLFNI